MPTNDPPPPGSDEAVWRGCTCPVLTNNHGRGYVRYADGRVLYVFTEGCPVHAKGEAGDVARG